MAALHGTGRKRDDPQKHQVTQPWNQSPQPPRSAVARVPWEAAAGGGGGRARELFSLRARSSCAPPGPADVGFSGWVSPPCPGRWRSSSKAMGVEA